MITTALYCLSLFIGPFLAGNIPLALSLAPAHQILLSTYAAGLLTGTALLTILPEGMYYRNLIYEAYIN